MLKQNLQLKLSQKLSPQQIQLMKLIQLPTQAFEQRLQEEMVENPALESGKDENVEFDEFSDANDDYDDTPQNETEDINIDDYLSSDDTPDYKYQSNNYSDDDEDKSMPFVAGVTFHQDLLNQLNTFVLDDTERDVAEFLVGSINDTGYIRRTIQDMVDDMAFTQGVYTDEGTVDRILKHVVQQLEPAGVGARDLQECLLLQLKHKTPTDSVDLAIDIIENQFDAFTKKHYDKLIQKYDISKEQLRNAIEEIEKLNPKPGSGFSGNQKPIEHVVPDYTIRIIDGELDLTLNGRNAPELHVSKEYQEMLQSYKDSTNKSAQKDAVQFIKQKLDSAKWFIDAIKQRQETLYVTMNAIMHYQQEYFLEGDETKLKPMILKDIADLVGLDISTVSRVANSKYVETPYGTKLIKEFFSEAMKNTDGEDVSTIEIKRILQNVIEEEDKAKPFPDDKLAEILKDKGYPIARRTVAKYREQLDIPVARLRKKI